MQVKIRLYFSFKELKSLFLKEYYTSYSIIFFTKVYLILNILLEQNYHFNRIYKNYLYHLQLSKLIE